MRADAFDVNRDEIRRRHHRPLGQAEFADRHAGGIVHAVEFVDGKTADHAVIEHRLGASAAFLGRLENDDSSAVEIAGLGEVACRAQKHRGVAVMAAGVHLAWHRRLVRQVVGLLDRQRVHVGAQRDRLAGRALAPTDDPDHAGAADPRYHLVAAEFREPRRHRGRSPVHLIEQLRMGVQIAPPGGDVGMQVGDTVDDRHGR